MKKIITQIGAFFNKEWDFVKRFWSWRLVWIVYDLMWAMSVGFLGSAAGQVAGVEMDSSNYILYLLIGSFMWTYLASVFGNITWAITRERWEGTIEYTFMAPVKRILHLLGTSLFAIVWGLIRMLIVFTIASPVFEISFSQTNFITTAIILALATLPFVGLGTIIAIFPLIDHENGEKVPWFAEAILMMVSGIYYPVTVMPIWLQWVSKLSPAKYALEGIRAAIIDGVSIMQALPYIIPLFISGLITIPLGVWVFNIGEKYAKRTGKLKRDG